VSEAAKTKLRLKAVMRVSFQRSEKTNLDIFKRAPHYPGDLKSGEAFLFLSMTGDQLLFIYRNPIDFMGPAGKTWVVTDSRKLRLSGGTWNPHMLQNYAHELGLDLVGIKRFEQIHDEMMQARRQKAA